MRVAVRPGPDEALSLGYARRCANPLSFSSSCSLPRRRLPRSNPRRRTSGVIGSSRGAGIRTSGPAFTPHRVNYHLRSCSTASRSPAGRWSISRAPDRHARSLFRTIAASRSASGSVWTQTPSSWPRPCPPPGFYLKVSGPTTRLQGYVTSFTDIIREDVPWGLRGRAGWLSDQSRYLVKPCLTITRRGTRPVMFSALA